MGLLQRALTIALIVAVLQAAAAILQITLALKGAQK